MSLDHRRADLFVAQQFLDCLTVLARREQRRCERMGGAERLAWG